MTNDLVDLINLKISRLWRQGSTQCARYEIGKSHVRSLVTKLVKIGQRDERLRPGLRVLWIGAGGSDSAGIRVNDAVDYYVQLLKRYLAFRRFRFSSIGGLKGRRHSLIRT